MVILEQIKTEYRTLRRRLAALLLCGCLIFSLAPAAAAQDLRGIPDFYAKQQTGSTCTLASAAMMMRRRAYLDGLDNWSSITEGSLRRVAWSYVGLSHDFSSAGITVLHSAFSSSSSVETQLSSLLKTHPEGIVVYNKHVPHAILVTDYTDGQFYCSDPSSAAPFGRIPVSQCTISISNANYYWYVAVDSNTLTGSSATLSADSVNYPAKLKTGEGFALSGTLASPGSISKVQVSVKNDAGDTVLTAQAAPEIGDYDISALNEAFNLASLKAGSYTFCLDADDNVGGHIRLKKQLLVTASVETTAAQYSGSVPSLTNVNAVDLTETGFGVEATATDPDDTVTSVLFSAWADSQQFEQGIIGQKGENDSYTTYIDAASADLGINSFLINITATDTDGNYARAALLVKVSADSTDLTEDSEIRADQLLL